MTSQRQIVKRAVKGKQSFTAGAVTYYEGRIAMAGALTDVIDRYLSLNDVKSALTRHQDENEAFMKKLAETRDSSLTLGGTVIAGGAIGFAAAVFFLPVVALVPATLIGAIAGGMGNLVFLESFFNFVIINKKNENERFSPLHRGAELKTDAIEAEISVVALVEHPKCDQVLKTSWTFTCKLRDAFKTAIAPPVAPSIFAAPAAPEAKP